MNIIVVNKEEVKIIEISEEELYLGILKEEGIKTEISYFEYFAKLIRNIPHWLEVIKERFSLKI